MGAAAHACAATAAVLYGAVLGVLFAPLHYRTLPEREFGGVGAITSPYRAKRIGDVLVNELEKILEEGESNWTSVRARGPSQRKT